MVLTAFSCEFLDILSMPSKLDKMRSTNSGVRMKVILLLALYLGACSYEKDLSGETTVITAADQSGALVSLNSYYFESDVREYSSSTTSSSAIAGEAVNFVANEIKQKLSDYGYVEVASEEDSDFYVVASFVDPGYGISPTQWYNQLSFWWWRDQDSVTWSGVGSGDYQKISAKFLNLDFISRDQTLDTAIERIYWSARIIEFSPNDILQRETEFKEALDKTFSQASYLKK